MDISRGATVTVSCGIFLQGLGYRVGNSELRILLAGYSLQPQQVKVHRNSRGASKGVATATFSSKAEADTAISVLNGKAHDGRVLTARIDINSKVIGFLEPLIVDGTNETGASSIDI